MVGTRCQHCIKNTRENNLICIVRVLARYMEYHINIRIEFTLYRYTEEFRLRLGDSVTDVWET